MQILLLILKIILIILLTILGIVLLAVGFVLFVPIRYDIKGEIKDEHQIEAEGSIRYLLSIFRFQFLYRENQLETAFYLFGKCKNFSEDYSTDSRESVADTEPINREEVLAEAKIAEEDVTNPEKISEPVPAVEETSNENQKITSYVQSENRNEAKNKKPKPKKEKSHIDFELIKKELTDEHNHSVLKKFFKELKYLFKHFKFRKIKTDFIFGLSDPAITGQILGAIAVLPIIYQYDFKLTPDFMTEKAYIKGTFAVNGRVRLIHILTSALRLIFDKEVRLVINKFMNMIK